MWLVWGGVGFLMACQCMCDTGIADKKKYIYIHRSLTYCTYRLRHYTLNMFRCLVSVPVCSMLGAGGLCLDPSVSCKY